MTLFSDFWRFLSYLPDVSTIFNNSLTSDMEFLGRCQATVMNFKSGYK